VVNQERSARIGGVARVLEKMMGIRLGKANGGAPDEGLIGQGVEVSGNITFADRLEIEGKVTGKISSEGGSLIIGEFGTVKAEIDIGVCVIHGNLEGDLTARSRVEIHRTGRVAGDLLTPILIVEEGAIFNGAVRMSQEAVERKALVEVESEPNEIQEKRKTRGIFGG